MNKHERLNKNCKTSKKTSMTTIEWQIKMDAFRARFNNYRKGKDK